VLEIAYLLCNAPTGIVTTPTASRFCS